MHFSLFESHVFEYVNLREDCVFLGDNCDDGDEL